MPMVNISTHELTDVSTRLIASFGLVSDRVCHIFQLVLFATVCEVVVIFGTVTNIINITCFVKQGFKDSMNVSLLGLAISDLGCLSSLFFSNLCYNPSFQALDLHFEPIEMQYFSTGWMHVIFARVTSCITALITLERCVCIVLPVKVKLIVTPGRVAVIIIFLFVLLIGSVSPVYYANRLDWQFSPLRNKTLLRLVFTPDREQVEMISFAINNIIVPFSAFIVVIVCTIVLAVILRRKSTWRENSTTSAQAQATSHRDRKVAKMVVGISTLFILCYFPLCAIFTAMVFVPELSVDGRYRNTLIVLCGFVVLLQSTNSALNIFIYYKMSSKYRAIFRKLFRI